ncbi:hypothetical protein TPA0910_68060 [Streptomyces hygroscopicus subsp. sporocinereus]|uniref:Uncharacterized protein n=1 Tax=Streptomyces hygroscopicus TaxID=1912 RepID=A0ABQ3U9S6_STRHY|nr:hypothetical protein TPA0910_68060 [Streptomyces hygroscopicus]
MNRSAAMKTGEQSAPRSRHTRTSGGSSDSDAKELAVNPCSVPDALRVVTIVTPEGKRANAERKAAGSSP